MNYDKDSLLSADVLTDPQKVCEAIAAGADVNVRNPSGWTPLHLTMNSQIVCLLIKAGADVNARDRMGWTPLHLVLSLQTAITLLEAGADWTLIDNEGRTAEQTQRLRGASDIADTIKRWVTTSQRAEALNEKLDKSEAQQGPGL